MICMLRWWIVIDELYTISHNIIMNNTILSISIDPTTKRQAEVQAEKIGVRLESFTESILDKALKAFIKNIKKNAFGTSIVIRIDEEPSKRLLASMKKARENRKKGNTSPAFHTVKDMNAWFDEQGV